MFTVAELAAVVIPLIVLIFSIGVATATVRAKLNRHEEKLDLMLEKQDTTNGSILEHSEKLLEQGFINRETDRRLVDLEKAVD